MIKKKIKVLENENGYRIDRFISEQLNDITRSQVQNLIENNNVLSNKTAVKKNYKVKTDDIIEVEIPDPIEYNIAAQNIPLDIVYEDNDLLVVNKPKGMVVHPAAGNYENTLVNALLYHCKDSLSGINGIMRPGIVHRIDKNTSGLLIVAKNDFAHQKLASQIKNHDFDREYEAIVYGILKNKSGSIDAPIGRHPIDRKKMAVTNKSSKHAITYYTVLNEYEKFSHLRLKLETGRTHQIRVHMAYIGHPVAGDEVYGPKKTIKHLNGQCLHAKYIKFLHPRKNVFLELESDLPDYFVNFINEIK